MKVRRESGYERNVEPTSAISGMEIKSVALITDGRFSGGTRGLV